jgi:AcrR family transcriptional regulator
MKQDSVDKPIARATSRKPCQARGQQRVEAILEAAGALVATEGSVSGLTMHKLAEAAQTSIGSLYHFFPDKDCVIAALEENHSLAFTRIVGDLALLPDAEWLPLNAQEVINRVFEPFFRYANAHQEVFHLDCGRDHKNEPTLRNLFDKILKLRQPGIAAKQRFLYAHMLESIIIGTSQNFSRAHGISKTEWTREVTMAQAAYLRSIEERHAAKPQASCAAIPDEKSLTQP